MTTALLPPATRSSIGEDRAAARLEIGRGRSGVRKTGENSRPTSGEYSTPAHNGAYGGGLGTVRAFDTSGWREATAHKWPVEPVAGLAFAPDGLKAAAGGNEGQVVVWDVDL